MNRGRPKPPSCSVRIWPHTAACRSILGLAAMRGDCDPTACLGGWQEGRFRLRPDRLSSMVCLCLLSNATDGYITPLPQELMPIRAVYIRPSRRAKCAPIYKHEDFMLQNVGDRPLELFESTNMADLPSRMSLVVASALPEALALGTHFHRPKVSHMHALAVATQGAHRRTGRNLSSRRVAASCGREPFAASEAPVVALGLKGPLARSAKGGLRWGHSWSSAIAGHCAGNFSTPAHPKDRRAAHSTLRRLRVDRSPSRPYNLGWLHVGWAGGCGDRVRVGSHRCLRCGSPPYVRQLRRCAIFDVWYEPTSRDQHMPTF